ncbi:type VII secretion-associated protein, Rv3446c family, C-terminal domain-containing protein [Amycolatopsis sacchari]|uniref:Type VII secretion-associated protein, Rv3446c family, C-terminal domain-containing protein n=1 Tax=Amycolatopsis sacchari TaxID=115433 RepID=A0A1I3NUR6_9PSEU|nr:type VII secretion-associated protein [Amycolatopsis sacchari]SFJ12872.1 type VII secretion-associated protein, Rv3446c family, C-terminal domain-containing protein [Amycolatopsis sacchari]
MTLRVAVDFGTSSTCVVAALNGREPQVAVIDGHPLMSSAVYAAADGTLFVGQEAERQAAVDPSRYEPHPKRRIDEGELLLGDTVLRVTDVVRAVLSRAVSEARRLASGAEVDLLVLTHPADWGAVRTRLLRQAAGGLAREVTLVPEPVAAAVFHAATFPPLEVNRDRTVEMSKRPGETLAVLDLGGGTVDVSVVSRPPANGNRGRFQVLATRGDPSFGGADVDQALLEHVGSLVSSADPAAWRELVEGRELVDRRRRRVLRQDVRGAKETLSRHAYTDIPLPPPFPDAHVTREDLEKLIAAPLSRTVELTCAAIEEAGLRPKQLTAIFLVGGSSRIPMISRLVHERTGVVPTTLDQPETVVARGALLAVRQEPARPPAPRPLAEQRTELVRGPNAPRPGFASRPPVRPPAAFAPPRPPAPPVSPPHGIPAAQAPEAPRRKRKLLWLGGGAVVVVAAVVAGLLVWLGGGDEPPQGKVVAQYHYQFSAPQDWTQTGGQPQFRETLIKPADATTQNDAISVQEYELAYDATADPRQLADNLRKQAEQAGDEYSGFDAAATFGGRQVIYYRQAGKFGPIDWYVLAQGRVQVNVACQYAGQQVHDRVAAACDQVVRSLQITG